MAEIQPIGGKRFLTPFSKTRKNMASLNRRAFLGTAVALREDSHAKIDLFLEKAPGRLKTYLILIKYSLMLALSALLIVTGTNHVISIWYTKAAYMRFLSMGWMYLSIPLCGLLMLLFSFVSVLELFSQRDREQ